MNLFDYFFEKIYIRKFPHKTYRLIDWKPYYRKHDSRLNKKTSKNGTE